MLNDAMKGSLCQLLLKKEKEFTNQMYLRQPRQGVWHELTWGEVMLQARKVASFLSQIGLKRGSHVAILSKNCAEWFITDFGICLAGMVTVPLYTNQHKDSMHYVLNHADIQLVFIGKLDDHQLVRQSVPEQYQTVNLGYHLDIEVTYHWSDVMKSLPLVEINEPKPDDLYTIIYSSGTTGHPKGAMYTHQCVANYLALFSKDIVRIRNLPHYRLISYLPLAHVYERSAIQLGSVAIPAEVSFVESLDKFVDNLKSVEPVFFTAVPRIWGVFQQKIEQKISAARLRWLLKIPVLSGYLKRKIRKQLGLGACLNCFSGASQLPVSILAFFDQLGVFIQEGYGQTENMAYATLSLLPDRRIGYVGTPRLEVQMKIGLEQELLLYSPCLMTGYYKDKQATKAVFTSDGWLKTGDIAELDALNRVKILGRASENFKNQTGEFVAPTPIENLFSAHSDIEQLCLIGNGLPTNVLIVTLNDQARIRKSKMELKKELQEQLGLVNSQLAKYEKISHVIVAKDSWTTNNNLLTPTLKVKRRMVEQQFRPLVQEALRDHQTIIWEEP